jgi:hypothetical protein
MLPNDLLPSWALITSRYACSVSYHQNPQVHIPVTGVVKPRTVTLPVSDSSALEIAEMIITSKHEVYLNDI